MSKPKLKSRCEDIGFVHAWKDFFFDDGLPQRQDLRRCQNCNKLEELAVVQPAQKEVREWQEVKP